MNKLVSGILYLIVGVYTVTSIGTVVAGMDVYLTSGDHLAIIPIVFFSFLTHGYVKLFNMVEEEFERV